MSLLFILHGWILSGQTLQRNVDGGGGREVENVLQKEKTVNINEYFISFGNKKEK